MPGALSISRIRDRLGAITADPVALRVEAARALAAAVPFDAWCCATLDPETLVRTSAVSEGLPRGRAGAVAANEYIETS